MNFTDKLILAIDFDGTIVEDAYPSIGKPKLFAFETLKRLNKDGHRLILWTYRSDIRLTEAVEFCKKNGLEFYAVNKSFPEEQYDYTRSRKIHADISLPELAELFGEVELPIEGKEIEDVFKEFQDKVLLNSVRINNPRYIGHMATVVPWFSVVVDILITSIYRL